MATLDAVSLVILLGAALVLAGIMSSLVALRFGAPLLLVFLAVGMLAGEGGPGGIKFDDVRTTYLVGSIALALILFDGGLHTRLITFRSVLAPSLTLATIGVILTAMFAAPFAKYLLNIGWTEALLVGAVVSSTDAAAVFFLVNAQGLRLRPRVAAALEVESATNDPFAIFMTIVLVEILLTGQNEVSKIASNLATKAVGGALFGFLGGWAIVLVLNRLGLSQGLHALFVATAAVVIFALSEAMHASGFLAVYLAGLTVGNQQIRAKSNIVVFLDAITWLAQIVMFVLLGLLAWPEQACAARASRAGRRRGVDVVCTTSGDVALSVAVSLFVSGKTFFVLGRATWRSRDIPRVDSAARRICRTRKSISTSDLSSCWCLSSCKAGASAFAAHRLHVALPPGDPDPHRVELDLPGQLAHELGRLHAWADESLLCAAGWCRHGQS